MEKGPIDVSTPFGKRIAERLETEIMVWLTTVAPDGAPQPNPVWFLWDGSTLLVYSHNPRSSPSCIRSQFESHRREPGAFSS